MTKGAFFIALALIASTWPSQAVAKSVRSEFEKTWTDRNWRYHGQYVEEVKSANEAIGEFQKALTPETLTVAMDKVRQAETTRARGELLNSLLELMEDKPSENEVILWFQERASDLKAKIAAYDATRVKLQAMDDSTPLPTTIETIQRSQAERGAAEGHYEELTLIEQNLSIYLPARDQEKAAKRRAFRAFLAGAGASLQNSQGAFAQPNMGPPTRTTCREFGGVVNCSTQ